MFNPIMKHTTSNVRSTIRNDVVHEQRHRVSFVTGQLRRLLRSSTSAADLIRCGRFVPASLSNNQPDWGPGCWVPATCQEQWIQEFTTKQLRFLTCTT